MGPAAFGQSEELRCCCTRGGRRSSSSDWQRRAECHCDRDCDWRDWHATEQERERSHQRARARQSRPCPSRESLLPLAFPLIRVRLAPHTQGRRSRATGGRAGPGEWIVGRRRRRPQRESDLEEALVDQLGKDFRRASLQNEGMLHSGGPTTSPQHILQASRIQKQSTTKHVKCAPTRQGPEGET